MEAILFYLGAGVVVISAILSLILREPLRRGIFFILCIFLVAGLFILLRAPFLVLVHLVIAVVGIMVLSFFSVILMPLQENRKMLNRQWVPSLILVGTGGGILSVFLVRLFSKIPVSPILHRASFPALYRIVFGEYLIAVALVMILYLAAIIGIKMYINQKL